MEEKTMEVCCQCFYTGVESGPIEGQILGFGKAVVSFRKTVFEHAAVFVPHIVKPVSAVTDRDTLFRLLRIRGHVHEGKLKAHRTVKEVEEAAVFLEDRLLVLRLRQLVVDVLEFQRLRIIPFPYTADPVGKHPLEGNGLLRRAGYAVIFPVFPFHLLHGLPVRCRKRPERIRYCFFFCSEYSL